MTPPKTKYPVGIQTFSEIIRGNYLYIDKTDLIYELTHSARYVALSRPRRFGKSLLMSAIESYFNGDRELFRGLAIDALEKEWNRHPVFRFDLSAANYDQPEKIIWKINMFLTRWEREYGVKAEGGISERFSNLLYYVFKSTGRQSVVLIDEYDKPILDTLTDDEVNERMKGELRGFYAVLKESDAYIRFAMLTGITRFSKVSIFSGLNNISDISLRPAYNSICGISETEFRAGFRSSVVRFAQVNNLTEEETWNRFKTLYDGYRFAKRGENIYNPYSVLRAFDEEELGDYWFSSGAPSHLMKLLKGSTLPLNSLEGSRRGEHTLLDISNFQRDSVPFLFQAGYLTIKGYDSDEGSYILGFPNEEVIHAFWQSLAASFFNLNDASVDFNEFGFLSDVYEGRPEHFMKKLQSLYADTNPGIERNKEIHFQNMVAITFKMLGLRVHTEVESSAGRCDMQLLTPAYVYIFEFKLDGSAESALRQIHDRGYARPFQSGRREIILIGANFSTSVNTLDSWVIERMPV